MSSSLFYTVVIAQFLLHNFISVEILFQYFKNHVWYSNRRQSCSIKSDLEFSFYNIIDAIYFLNNNDHLKKTELIVLLSNSENRKDRNHKEMGTATSSITIERHSNSENSSRLSWISSIALHFLARHINDPTSAKWRSRYVPPPLESSELNSL